MRALVFAALALLTACGPDYTRSMPLGGRDVAVAIVDCREPQREYVAAEIEYFGWHVSDVGEVTVRCADTGVGGGAEEFALGSNEVLLDPAKASGEFALRAASGHGAVHWLINRGPHPSRARYHVCSWPANERPPPDCYPHAAAKSALMSPMLGTVSGDINWTREVFTGVLTEYRVTEVDKEFVGWALMP